MGQSYVNQVKPGKEFETFIKRLTPYIDANQSGCSIGNEWLSSNEETITSTSPVYDKSIATIHTASKNDIDKIFTEANLQTTFYKDLQDDTRVVKVQL